VDVGESKLVELDVVGRETRIFHRWKTTTALVAVAVAAVDEKTEVEAVGTLFERKTKSCSSRSRLLLSLPSLIVLCLFEFSGRFPTAAQTHFMEP
jgi:hypothetical protein